jgi:hypothetical protein
MDMFIAFLANHHLAGLPMLLYILDLYFSLKTSPAPAVEAVLCVFHESIDRNRFGASIATFEL